MPRDRIHDDHQETTLQDRGRTDSQDYGPYGRADNLDYTFDRGYYAGNYHAPRDGSGGSMGHRPYLYGAARGPAPRGDLGRTADGQFPSARDRFFNGPDDDRAGFEMYRNPDLVGRAHGNAYGSSPGMGGATGLYAALRGEHAGKGPRNHRPNDRRLGEDVCEELTWHPLLDATDVEVQVEGGEVTLSGRVPERRQKRLAEDLALGVRGVREVHNHLRVT